MHLYENLARSDHAECATAFVIQVAEFKQYVGSFNGGGIQFADLSLEIRSPLGKLVQRALILAKGETGKRDCKEKEE